MTLSKGERDAIAGAVQRLRALFEEEFTQQATGTFGLHTKRREAVGSDRDPRSSDDSEPAIRQWVEPLDALAVTPTQEVQRNELVGAVAYLRREGLDGGEAVTRLIREAAFTATNQLLAVRVAEAIGVLPEVTAQGRRSSSYRDVVHDLFPLLAQDSNEGLWTYIQVCGDELGATVPLLFDRRLPTGAFVPERTCVDDALAIINDPVVAPAWGEPEALGWAYQFFNKKDEREKMREESAAPRNSRELAVRNQFFTPRYVVDWLVQNTLGRRLREAGYNLHLPLLMGDVATGPPLPLDEVRIIDPAVGSGHFLLGCYDVLEQAWQTQGVSPSDAAPQILRSLHGIEIDPRASQVAQAVLVLRARRAAPEAELVPPAIVTARPLPAAPDVRREVFGRLSNNARDLAEELNNALEQATTLGSLLDVERRLDAVLGQVLYAPKLDEGEVTADKLERELIDATDELARRADATAAARLFAADARDAVRFVQLCTQRYDVVLMNPPFGDAIPDTKDYLKSVYGRSSTDIFSAFVHRGRDLLREAGYVGAITNRTGLFLKTFADWRERIVLPHLVCAADLGHGVLHEALVEAATYVLAQSPNPSPLIIFRNLLREANKERLAQPDAGITHQLARDAFELLPNTTMSYWVSPSVLAVFRDHKELGSIADVRQGLATADDFRFVRLWWEVPPDQVGARWFAFAKGGEYAPYYADLHLVVDWEDGGRRLREFDRAVVRNPEFYFKPGLTWSRRTASGFALRALPQGSVFADKGCFIGAPDHAQAMGWGNSRPTRYLIELQLAAGETTSSGGAARSYEVGIVNSLPYPEGLSPVVAETARRLAKEHAAWAATSEVDSHFVSWVGETSPWLPSAGVFLDGVLSVDEAVSAAYGLDDEAKEAIDQEIGPAPASYPKEIEIDIGRLGELMSMSMQLLVNHALQTLGGARHLAMKNYAVDRRLELICHLLRAHPAAVTEAQQRLGVLPPEVQRVHARRLISYLVGAAFGRWDIRCFGAATAEINPWAATTAVPPGMLTDERGTPTRVAPPGYPTALPPEPILVDDPGATWDFSTRVEHVAAHLNLEREVERTLRVLGYRELRNYLRKTFFGDHLDTYSMSRRKAPLYWQLGVPSGKWATWLYYPELSRESLFALLRTAQEKLHTTRTLLEQLQAHVVRENAPREMRDRYESAQTLTGELRDFVTHAESVAQSGWQPDFNDGAVLCAVPLEPLFLHASWKGELANHRTALEQRKYPWATVQQQLFGSGS